MQLKDRIKQIRQELGISQSVLSNELGVSLDRIKSIETGKVKKLHPNEIHILTRKFNINSDWLLTGQGEMYSSNHSAPPQNDLPPDIETILEYLKDMDKSKRKKVLKFILELED